MPSNNSEIHKLAHTTYGKIIICYVCWVIRKAQEKGLKTLYFLARDGYVLRETAVIICKKLSIEIDCRYLYCSRQSLRIPSFHLIGKEMYDYIFMGAEKLTANVIMSRTGLDNKTVSDVYREIGFDAENANKSLSKEEFNRFCNSLINSDLFFKSVMKESEKSYSHTMGYLNQEKLTEQKNVAIVDSGWSGSMQKTLYTLLNSSGFTGKITGFYFGLFSVPDEKKYGDYLTYYFSPKGCLKRKILFSNNLFECMLSAPHGMTVGYRKENNMYFPVFSENNNSTDDLIFEQINGIKELAANVDNSFLEEKNCSELIKNCQKEIISTMVKPKRSTAITLGEFSFCDDCGDAYRYKLADESQIPLLKNYLIIPRIFRKLVGKKREHSTIFWVYGVIALLPRQKQWWYRWNIFIWESLRFIKIRI